MGFSQGVIQSAESQGLPIGSKEEYKLLIVLVERNWNGYLEDDGCLRMYGYFEALSNEILPHWDQRPGAFGQGRATFTIHIYDSILVSQKGKSKELKRVS